MIELSEQVEIKIRFSEVDSLAIVWHGHYAKYFEDAREAFGRKFGLGYHEVYSQGFTAPIVDLYFEFKKSLYYNDKALVKATFIDSKAAKIIFDYEILNASTHELVAIGKSTQVFLMRENSGLCLTIPEFYNNWKREWRLLE
jgi:Predicted thioesterase